MEVQSYKYPASFNPNFKSTYYPGSIRIKPQNLYKAKIYSNSGTHGILKTQYTKHVKERNVNGYVMERGVSTFKFKTPKMYTQSQLKEIEKTPRSGSLMRVVQNVNTEAYLNYNDLFQDKSGQLFRREFLNGQERKVPAEDLADRRANIQAVEDARNQMEQQQQQEQVEQARDNVMDGIQNMALGSPTQPTDMEQQATEEGTGLATGGPTDMLLSSPSEPGSPMDWQSEKQKMSELRDQFKQQRKIVKTIYKTLQKAKEMYAKGNTTQDAVNKLELEYATNLAYHRALNDEIKKATSRVDTALANGVAKLFPTRVNSPPAV